MLFGRALALVVMASSLVACAEEEEPKTLQPDEPDEIETEVREHCSDFAARLCTSAASCCQSTAGSFSSERCTSSFVEEFCVPASQVVAAGLATYHPDAHEPCLSAWERAHATCEADWEEIIAVRKDVWAECKMIRGTVEPGRGCSTQASCARPDGPTNARCQLDVTMNTTCQLLEILGEGAACPFPMGDVSVCDVGLYCTTTERDMPGTCAPSVPEGGPCDPEVPANSECGLGSYCGLDDALCHRATNFGGGSCEQDAECISFECQGSSTGGTCLGALSTAQDLCERGA